MLSQFSRDLSKHLEGIPLEDGLLQAIKPEQQKFKKAIRDTAPAFVPYTLRNQVNTDIPDYQHKNGKEVEEDLLYDDSSIAPASMPYTLRGQADTDFTDYQPVNEEQAEEDLVYDDSSTALPPPVFLAHEEDTSGTFVGKNEIYINQVMDQAEMCVLTVAPNSTADGSRPSLYSGQLHESCPDTIPSLFVSLISIRSLPSGVLLPKIYLIRSRESSQFTSRA